MVVWLLTNASLYLGALGLSYLAVRRLSMPLRLIMAAWLVVAVKYLPFGYSLIRELWSGRSGTAVLWSWPVACPSLTLIVVSLASALAWRGREDLAVLGFVVLAANWILFEVLGARLTLLTWPMWTWGVPALSVGTLVVFGTVALLKT